MDGSITTTSHRPAARLASSLPIPTAAVFTVSQSAVLPTLIAAGFYPPLTKAAATGLATASPSAPVAPPPLPGSDRRNVRPNPASGPPPCFQSRTPGILKLPVGYRTQQIRHRQRFPAAFSHLPHIVPARRFRRRPGRVPAPAPAQERSCQGCEHPLQIRKQLLDPGDSVQQSGNPETVLVLKASPSASYPPPGQRV